MYDLHSGGWSQFTLDLFDVPIDCLPPIKPVNMNMETFLIQKFLY